jgi:hypothetical protein
MPPNNSEDIDKQIEILQKEQASLAAKESKKAAKKAAILAAYKAEHTGESSSEEDEEKPATDSKALPAPYKVRPYLGLSDFPFSKSCS